jgi:hypothetical protein
MEMMKTTIFSFLVIFFSLVLEGAELITKSYEIESQENVTQLNMKAELEAIKIVRDYAFLSAIGIKSNINLSKECWKAYITNKKITFDASQVRKKFIKKTNNKHSFEVTFDPDLISLSPKDKEGFLLSCSKKLRS